VTRFQCGDQLLEVELRRRGRGAFEAVVNGERLDFALAELGEGRCLVTHEGRPAWLHFAREGRTLHLFWEGRAYRLAPPKPAARAAGHHVSGALEAPMPGRVSAVKVEPGERVAKGQELVVVEAMKMENALRAPHAGVVRAVHVRPGDMVAPGRPLVEIDEPGAGGSGSAP
jgi:acetyl/propionyl-CoA carboxylase alpha subunit